jgi:pimeloyl-ACP methyl ester carboxylesterase
MRGLALAAVVLVGSCAAAGMASAEEHSRAQAPVTQEPAAEPAGVRLTPCAMPVVRGFNCGRIRVPFERSDPSLGTTRIGFAVRPRGDRSRPSLGAIWAIEGGPGYSSTGSAKYYKRLFRGLLRRHELILSDTRGTGFSDALRCGKSQSAKVPGQSVVARCAAQLGPRFASYRTQAAADDIEQVRRALGVGRILLYGDSYGTFLAQSYAFRHPDSLRAVVLDSAYPLLESPWYPSGPRTGMRSIVLACSRSTSCPPGARARLNRAVHRLRRDGHSVVPLVNRIWSAGNSGPKAYLQIDRAIRTYLGGGPVPSPGGGDVIGGGGGLRAYSRAMELVFSCNDYPMLWKKGASEQDRRIQLRRAVKAYPSRRFAPFNADEVSRSIFLGYRYCLTAHTPGPLYQPPRPPGATGTRAPVLVVSGEMDAVTTPTEGLYVTNDFPNARQLIFPNAAHVDALYHAKGAAARAIRAFMRRH